MNGSSPKYGVSVIVAAYNVSSYIVPCLDSLVNQTLHPIEIIVVDDASTDDTSVILKAYEKYDFVKVIRLQKNVNLAGVRRIGIEHARGEYIGFVDGDDFVDVTMFEVLYQKAVSASADVAVCLYYELLHTGERKVIHPFQKGKTHIEEDIEKFNKRDLPIMIRITPLWNKIWHRRLFEELNQTKCDMPTQLYLAEDLALGVVLSSFAQKMAYTPSFLYFYRVRQESDACLKIRHVRDIRAVIDFIIDFFSNTAKDKDGELISKLIAQLQYHLIRYYLLELIRISKTDVPREQIFYAIREMLRQKKYNTRPVLLWMSYYEGYFFRKGTLFYTILNPIRRVFYKLKAILLNLLRLLKQS